MNRLTFFFIFKIEKSFLYLCRYLNILNRYLNIPFRYLNILGYWDIFRYLIIQNSWIFPMRLDYKIIAVESTENDLMLLSLRKTFQERRGWNPDVSWCQSKRSSSILNRRVSFYIIKPSRCRHLTSEFICADVLPILLLDFHNETYNQILKSTYQFSTNVKNQTKSKNNCRNIWIYQIKFVSLHRNSKQLQIWIIQQNNISIKFNSTLECFSRCLLKR